jgi:hypothetical protein
LNYKEYEEEIDNSKEFEQVRKIKHRLDEGE